MIEQRGPRTDEHLLRQHPQQRHYAAVAAIMFSFPLGRFRASIVAAQCASGRGRQATNAAAAAGVELQLLHLGSLDSGPTFSSSRRTGCSAGATMLRGAGRGYGGGEGCLPPFLVDDISPAAVLGHVWCGGGLAPTRGGSDLSLGLLVIILNIWGGKVRQLPLGTMFIHDSWPIGIWDFLARELLTFLLNKYE